MAGNADKNFELDGVYREKREAFDKNSSPLKVRLRKWGQRGIC